MDHSDQISVCLYNVSTDRLFEESRNDHIAGLGDNESRAYSSIISVDAGTQYDAYVTIPDTFVLQGAGGILLSISEGHTHNEDHSMQDTQIMYIPRLSCGTVEGDYIVSSFRRWNASGRDALHDLRVPQPNPDRKPGAAPHTLRPCLKANQGAIKVTLQRVTFKRSGSNYIIRRKNPDHDISTVPPECYRAKPRIVNDELRIINQHWVTPLEGEPGLPYVFEFVNVQPEPLSDELDEAEALIQTVSGSQVGTPLWVEERD
ncbi:hypothetical protein B0A54_16128 [Friedmanniomyces endolithicus]|uniref:Uncharacterized protein n=1 Tax=Friedmanniomyces endolithicus TaxID=329885 RepID=A0A4V5N4M2_9PEZI|nr:hypothetical protein LTS09_011399 [Friedmanniomyces endolithicus]TKA28329.1 hypothetical protein B0A54_16128 [Friedmanniomyces endolithicus]